MKLYGVSGGGGKKGRNPERLLRRTEGRNKRVLYVKERFLRTGGRGHILRHRQRARFLWEKGERSRETAVKSFIRRLLGENSTSDPFLQERKRDQQKKGPVGNTERDWTRKEDSSAAGEKPISRRLIPLRGKKKTPMRRERRIRRGTGKLGAKKITERGGEKRLFIHFMLPYLIEERRGPNSKKM